jgi:hypothetical protein
LPPIQPMVAAFAAKKPQAASRSAGHGFQVWHYRRYQG